MKWFQIKCLTLGWDRSCCNVLIYSHWQPTLIFHTGLFISSTSYPQRHLTPPNSYKNNMHVFQINFIPNNAHYAAFITCGKDELHTHKTKKVRKIYEEIIHDIFWLEMKPLILSCLLYWLQTALWLFLWLKWHWSAWWQTQWNRHCSTPAIRKRNVSNSMF